MICKKAICNNYSASFFLLCRVVCLLLPSVSFDVTAFATALLPNLSFISSTAL